jgi:hypothetical protein
VLSSVYGVQFAILWLGRLAYWFFAALNVKRTQRREPVGSLLLNRGLLAIGVLLLAFERLPLPWLSERFLPLSMAFYWIGLVMLAAGLTLAVWARRHLGRNWSGIVTVKQDHELIRPLCSCPPPDLQRAASGNPRYGGCHWRMARSYCLCLDYGRLRAEVQNGRMVHERNIRRAIRALSRRGAVAHSVCYLKQVNAFKEPLCRQGQ